jgi:hypothetical protein
VLGRSAAWVRLRGDGVRAGDGERAGWAGGGKRRGGGSPDEPRPSPGAYEEAATPGNGDDGLSALVLRGERYRAQALAGCGVLAVFSACGFTGCRFAGSGLAAALVFVALRGLRAGRAVVVFSWALPPVVVGT